MVFAKFLFVVALTTASASECTNCAVEDETSFVQLKQSVQQGGDRLPNEAAGWPTPVHNWDAVTDSTPDHLDDGQVMSSFKKNKGKVEDEIETEAADRIGFTSQEREARKLDYQEAANKVTKDKDAVEKAYKEDNEAVAAVHKERVKKVMEDAAKVKAAKQAAKAHAIKAAQADHAAALGRRVGTIAGQDAAHHAWEDYAAEVKKEHEAAALKVTKDNLAAHTAAVKSHIKAETAAMHAADEAWVARANRAATVAKAKAAAAAAKAEVGIEGPEGLKNEMSDVKAGWAELHYNREKDASQADIDGDAAGSIGIPQSVTDYDAAGPAEGVPLGMEFTPPGAGVGTTAFQSALSGADSPYQ